MIGQPYWRSLQWAHQQSMSADVGPAPIDQYLSFLLVGLCALTASILFAVGGYTAGFEAIHGIGSNVPAAVLQTLSMFGQTMPAICLLALMAKRGPRIVWMVVLASVYATLLTHALKGLCETPRPAAVLGAWVTATGPVLKLHSFPSGHTVTAFLLAACFSAGAAGGARFACYCLAAAVGVCRVWVGAHWPIDVITGAGVAALSVGLAIPTMKFTEWGMCMAAHLLVVVLISVCAVLELVRATEYPLAHLPSVATAAVSLSVLARDYLFRPLARRAAIPVNL